MSESSQLVFVTGASGFLTSHIIYQLIKQGHQVRASARKNKLESLRALYKSHPNVEIVQIDDIAHGEFGDVFEGVDALIHTASPLAGRADGETILKSAIDGSLNVLQQAEKAGVKKFVVTSSTAAVAGDPAAKGVAFRPEHWSPLTKEDATRVPYAVSKKYAELAVWEWAEANPYLDVTTVNPPFLYGPFAPLHLPVSPGDYLTLSTSLMVYNFISPNGAYPPRPAYVDFRDVAAAHVGAALRAPAKPVSGRKRVIFASPHGFVLKDVLEVIRKSRPELASRVISTTPVPEWDFTRYDLDATWIENITGLKPEDFHTTEQTILDTVDDMVALEKIWQEKGYVLPKDVPEMTL